MTPVPRAVGLPPLVVDRAAASVAGFVAHLQWMLATNLVTGEPAAGVAASSISDRSRDRADEGGSCDGESRELSAPSRELGVRLLRRRTATRS